MTSVPPVQPPAAPETDPTAGERHHSHRSGGPAMSPLIDWDSPTWGQPGHNVHQAAWAADGRHDDVTEDQ